MDGARIDILMPVLSEDAEEGVLVTWFVTPGAVVREGDLIAEVQVEKAGAEVRAPAAGRVAELLAEPGAVVGQGKPIAVLEAGAAVPEPVPAAGDGRTAPPPAPAAGGRRPASPAARRLARELGVDLAGVTGSGPGGRIVEADVRAAAGAATGLTPMRRAIARRLTTALATAAQLTLTAEADVTALAASSGPGGRPPYTAAAVRAVAVAAARHPLVRRRWTDDGLVAVDDIDVGVAIALDDGLLAPAVRGADRKGVPEIAEEIAALAASARRGELSASGGDGAVLGVTSLGAHRVDAFTPLLDPSQTALLGIGRARPRPAVVDGAIAVRTLMALSLTFDHRVLDGDPAAAFLDEVLGLLEDPEALAAA